MFGFWGAIFGLRDRQKPIRDETLPLYRMCGDFRGTGFDEDDGVRVSMFDFEDLGGFSF